jgi:hypothetical protein
MMVGGVMIWENQDHDEVKTYQFDKKRSSYGVMIFLFRFEHTVIHNITIIDTTLCLVI